MQPTVLSLDITRGLRDFQNPLCGLRFYMACGLKRNLNQLWYRPTAANKGLQLEENFSVVFFFFFCLVFLNLVLMEVFRPLIIHPD